MSAFPFQPSLNNDDNNEPPRQPKKNSGVQQHGTPSYKDQVREAISDPNAVPIAAAVPVTESRIVNEQKASLERENLDQQRRILELERQQLEAERERRDERQRQTNESNGLSKKQWTYIGVIGALLLLVTAIVGVCSSGNCRGSGGDASAPAMTSPEQEDSPPTVQTTTAPVATAPSPVAVPVSAVSPTPRPIIPPPPVTPPSSTTSRSQSIVSYINSITLSSRILTYPNPGTLPEEKALNWLIDDDLGTSETNQLKLRQRFVLATLWFQNGPFSSAHTSTWLSSMDECDWESIDTCVGGEVTNIDLWSDGLKGQLPSELGRLTSLSELSLSFNQLTGSIPSELGRLTSLSVLDLYRNQLTGSIPSQLGRLTSMTSLWLSDNQLTGSIPSELGGLTSMTSLRLHINQLTGSIPSEFNQLTALEIFRVYNNNLSSDMPFCNGATRPSRFRSLEADCNEVTCECCTECCPLGGFNGIPEIVAGTCDA